jgi:hypothetical protein
MSRLLALSLTVLLAACGGGGSGGGDSPPAGNPAGGDNPGANPGTNNPGTSDPGANPGTSNPGTNTPDPTGPLAVTGNDLAFTPTGSIAIAGPATRCIVSATIYSMSVVAIAATTYPVACGGFIDERGDTSFLLVSVVRQRTDGQDATPIPTGTYSLTPTTADEPGAIVRVAKRGADGQLVPASLFGGTATAGTVTLTSVGATIAGSVDATLPGGQRVVGAFSVPACATPTAADICAAATGRPAPTTTFPNGTP